MIVCVIASSVQQNCYFNKHNRPVASPFASGITFFHNYLDVRFLVIIKHSNLLIPSMVTSEAMEDVAIATKINEYELEIILF